MSPQILDNEKSESREQYSFCVVMRCPLCRLKEQRAFSHCLTGQPDLGNKDAVLRIKTGELTE